MGQGEKTLGPIAPLTLPTASGERESFARGLVQRSALLVGLNAPASAGKARSLTRAIPPSSLSDQTALELCERGGRRRALSPRVRATASRLAPRRIYSRGEVQRHFSLVKVSPWTVVPQFEMVAIYAVWYNWIRIHKTLRETPAMASGLSKTLLTWEDILAIMDAEAPKPGPRGPYKKAAR